MKEAVRIPVIASLNGCTPGGWLSYGRLMEQGGADALELNVYHAALDPEKSGAEIERETVTMVREVKRSVKIPVAVKLSPFFTSFAHFALQLDREGADGLVLFNRFYEADIDVQELQVTRALHLSDSSELLLRLRGIAALAPRVKGVARRHRGRAHGARRGEIDDGGRACDADGVGAAEERTGIPAQGAQRTWKSGWKKTNGPH